MEVKALKKLLVKLDVDINDQDLHHLFCYLGGHVNCKPGDSQKGALVFDNLRIVIL